MSPRLTFPLLVVALIAASPLFGQSPTVEVYFSPKGGCTEAIVKEIGNAKSTVKLQAFEFTSEKIAEALVKASKGSPKVTVEVILDHSKLNIPGNKTKFLHDALGDSVRIDGNRHGIAHDKVIVVDGQVVITGSFNFTKAAEERNGENLLVIRDKDLAAKYTANWKAHAEHSEPYTARTE